VDEHGSALRQARDAYSEGDWTTAAAFFDSVADEQLTADDLATYFKAVWWLGPAEDALRVGAAAYEALLHIPVVTRSPNFRRRCGVPLSPTAIWATSCLATFDIPRRRWQYQRGRRESCSENARTCLRSDHPGPVLAPL